MGFDLGKTLFNPIGSALDAVGIGPEAGFDELTGRGDSKRNAEAAREARETQLAIHRENIALQREFAQHGVRWRVADAEAAGLHPLAALSANGASYSPSIPVIDPLPSEKDWKGQMGQNVRSFLINRINPTARALDALSVERAGLENDLLKLRIVNEAKGQAGSADPYLTGQGDSMKGNPMVVDEPLRRVVSDPIDPSKEVGAIQDWQIVRTEKGYAVVPAQGVKQAIEDSPMEYQWLIRAAARTYTLPDGRPAKMNPMTGELSPIKPYKSFGRDLWNKFKEGPFGIFRRP